MSMIRCNDCEDVVDSDFDPEGFIDTSPTTTIFRCEWCRERAEEAAERDPTRHGYVHKTFKQRHEERVALARGEQGEGS